MSIIKPGIEDLAAQIEKAVKEAISEEVELAIDRAFEDAKDKAKSKAGSIATRLAGMVDFARDCNRLIITVKTNEVK